jgi:hypothetical protein
MNPEERVWIFLPLCELVPFGKPRAGGWLSFLAGMVVVLRRVRIFQPVAHFFIKLIFDRSAVSIMNQI